MMHCASLKSRALHTVVCHLATLSFDSVCQNLLHSLQQNGIYETFGKLIFQDVVQKYPLSVCDQLVALCCHGNWREINIRNCRSVSTHALAYALTRCANITTLELSECDQLISAEFMDVLQQDAKSLRCLKLDGCVKLTDEMLQMIIQKLLQLTELSCEGCEKLHDLLPLKNMNRNANMLSNLTTVNLSGCCKISSSFVRHLTSLTKSNLQSLNLSGTSIDCMALVYLSGYSLSAAVNIATNCVEEEQSPFVFKPANKVVVPDIEDLDKVETLSTYMKKVCAYCSNDLAVRNCSDGVDSITVFSITDSHEDYDIIDSQVVNIVGTALHDENEKGDDLEWAVLSVKDVHASAEEKCTCFIYSSYNESDLSKSCDKSDIVGEKNFICEQNFVPNLTSLDVSSTNFCDSGFYHANVVKKCFHLFLTSNTKLKYFNMSWASEEVTDDMVSLIAEQQTAMESISLAGCIRVSNLGIVDMVNKFEHLRAIDLSGVSFVTDEPLLHLVGKHNQLQYMSLAESCLTDKVLHKIANVLKHSIRHLDLSWCENITDEGIVNVLSSCKKLTYLDLRQCEVAADTIKAVTEDGGNLQVIGLSGIKGINDTTCIKMVRNLPHLRRVDLSWNSSLTDESITALCTSCPCLQEITISGLKRITSKPFLPIISGILEWRQRRKKIASRLKKQLSPNASTSVRERDMSNFEALEPDFYLPFRSINYVPELRKLTLGYCDKVNDNHLAEIVAVSRGTLMIEDYYGAAIKARWSNLPITCISSPPKSQSI